MYFDFPGLQKYVDHFNLVTHDFRTSDRVPKLADHASPFKFVYADRLAWQNIESQVNKAIALKADRTKLVLGLATFGRTWKMDKDSGKSGAPPVNADGPGEEGTYTKTEGMLAYYEICPHLVESTAATTSLTLYRYNNINIFVLFVTRSVVSKFFWFLIWDDALQWSLGFLIIPIYWRVTNATISWVYPVPYAGYFNGKGLKSKCFKDKNMVWKCNNKIFININYRWKCNNKLKDSRRRIISILLDIKINTKYEKKKITKLMREPVSPLYTHFGYIR